MPINQPIITDDQADNSWKLEATNLLNRTETRVNALESGGTTSSDSEGTSIDTEFIAYKNETNTFSENQTFTANVTINGNLIPNGVVRINGETTFNGDVHVNSPNLITIDHDVEILGNGEGIYLHSPNGTRYHLSVTNAGELSVVQQDA